MVFENRDGKHFLCISSEDKFHFDLKSDLYFLSNDEVCYYYKIFKKEYKKRIFDAIKFAVLRGRKV